MAPFDHEKLEVYQVARELNREITRVLGDVPRGHAEPKDNLARGARSVTRNIAEGGGRWTIADKIHFYHIARGSATECAAGLDELVDISALSEGRTERAKTLASRIVAMLVKMIHSLESREGRDMSAPPPGARQPRPPML